MATHTNRRRVTACALLALAATLAVAPPPASAADAREATITASDTRIAYGDEVRLAGAVLPRRADRVVRLRYKRDGGTYQTVDTTQTDGDGRYHFLDAPAHTGRYRVRVPGESGGWIESDPVDVAVRAALSARSEKHVIGGADVTVQGRLRPELPGRRVVVQRERRDGWETIASDRTAADGSYRAAWAPTRTGSFDLRAKFEGDDLNDRARAEVGHEVHVYRSSHASWYGPGFYGNTTACGQTLKRDTLGVAHKTLPCGTKVRFYYHGETEELKVIDRGPFIPGRDWDLTEAAKDKLGFEGVDEIWSTK